MPWHGHSSNYAQLQRQVQELKTWSLPTPQTGSIPTPTTTSTTPLTSKRTSDTFPSPPAKRPKTQKSANRLFQSPIPTFEDIYKLYHTLLLSKYQIIDPAILKVGQPPAQTSSQVQDPSLPDHGEIQHGLLKDTKETLSSAHKTAPPEPTTGSSSTPKPTKVLPHSDVQALAAECNAHIPHGDIPTMVKDLLNISKLKFNHDVHLEYDQLKDFDLLQIYQQVFIEGSNVPYNTGLNMIKYSLYVKIKNLSDIPSIQLISICDIVGKYNKRLLINGILAPLLTEDHFEKYQSQLIIKIFKEIKFTVEEYNLLLKNFSTVKYQNIRQSRNLTEDLSHITLNENHLSVLQTILQQKITFNNDILKEIINVYNLFNLSEIKKSKTHGMFLFSLCRNYTQIKISNENYQELVRLSNLHETFLKKKIQETLKKIK